MAQTVPYCDHDEVQDELAAFKEQPGTWSKSLTQPQIDKASEYFNAVLSTHFTMPTTLVSCDNRLRRICAKQAAVYAIDWRYAVSDENVPDFVERQQAKIDDLLERAKIAYGPKKIELGLTPLGEPTGVAALGRGVMDDKRAQTDRSRFEEMWEPADDGTTDDDAILGDQSVNT